MGSDQSPRQDDAEQSKRFIEVATSICAEASENALELALPIVARKHTKPRIDIETEEIKI